MANEGEFDFHHESTLVISIQWMGKLNHREIKILMGHLPARKWGQILLDPKPDPFPRYFPTLLPLSSMLLTKG